MNASVEIHQGDAGLITVETRNFGPISVREDQIILFTPGLLGFSQYHRYILIEHAQESPFLWLQCVDNPELAFVIIDPLYIMPGYQPGSLQEAIKEFGPTPLQDLRVFVILTIPPGRPQDMTANLMGPLIISLKNRCGKQLVVDHPDYSHKHRVLPQDD